MKMLPHFLIFALSIDACTTLPQSKIDSNCLHDSSTFRCVEHIGNYDGDTIRVNIPDLHPLLGNNIPVRVKGIDTAEINGKSPCERKKAVEAKDVVTTLLTSANKIELRNVSRDKYFRILADVFVGEISLSDVLIHRGLARRYSGGTKDNADWCSVER